MQRELRAFVEVHRGAPGVVVGLLDANGRRVHSFGKSGRPERRGLDGDTRFEIGSITKTFTGILLADMLLAGEVSAGQRVGTLFPRTLALDNGVQDATLEELATHASGLPRIAVDLPALARTMSVDPYRGTTADDVYRSAARVPSWLVRPTETLAYSNLGYALLGRLLELRGGQEYEELLRRRVLEPLGLGSIATAHEEPQPLGLCAGRVSHRVCERDAGVRRDQPRRFESRGRGGTAPAQNIPLTPAIALVLAGRLGAWQEVPFAAWWVALAVVVIAFAILVRQARALPWCRKGVWRAVGRGLMTALEVTVLALLFS